MSTDLTKEEIAHAIRRIQGELVSASQEFSYTVHPVEEEERYMRQDAAKYHMERAFTQTLVILEMMGLTRTHDDVAKLYAKATEAGLLKSAMGFDDPYLVWCAPLDHYLDGVGQCYGLEEQGTVVKDVIAVLRASLYSITDRKVFARAPKKEEDVHLRIECVLKCFFPDLKPKPRINKPVKSFEPDTGLPSIRTLLEYKYVSTKDDAKRVMDEILTDSRGYHSSEWDRVIYVIYETDRIVDEGDWNRALRDSGVPASHRVIVLQGVDPDGSRKSQAKRASRKTPGPKAKTPGPKAKTPRAKANKPQAKAKTPKKKSAKRKPTTK